MRDKTVYLPLKGLEVRSFKSKEEILRADTFIGYEKQLKNHLDDLGNIEGYKLISNENKDGVKLSFFTLVDIAELNLIYDFFLIYAKFNNRQGTVSFKARVVYSISVEECMEYYKYNSDEVSDKLSSMFKAIGNLQMHNIIDEWFSKLSDYCTIDEGYLSVVFVNNVSFELINNEKLNFKLDILENKLKDIIKYAKELQQEITEIKNIIK